MMWDSLVAWTVVSLVETKMNICQYVITDALYVRQGEGGRERERERERERVRVSE